jgi:glycosyltransferase involved in cell wall biosynthesis
VRILVSSHLFPPSIGGLEQVAFVLADQFVRFGHEVKVITQTPEQGDRPIGFPVFRRPGPLTLVRLVRWCDVYFHNNISLRTAWPMLLFHRPWVIVHHIWTSRPDGRLAWQDHLKRYAFRFATNIAISEAVRREIPASAVVIGNPYQAHLFRQWTGATRDRELVYLGRLVSDKGVDLLLEALYRLRSRGLRPKLTIIGSGPEEPALRALAAERGLYSQVRFKGPMQGTELADMLNAHQILVVPSLWKEPFGIVALEGIACGCVAVGSEGGGLKDAIGPCGVTFPNGDADALTAALEDLLTHPDKLQAYREAAAEHLPRFYPLLVARRYLDIFESAVRGKGGTGQLAPATK